MISGTFFKLTTLLSVFVFLSGIAMEPQKRSVKDIYADIRTNLDQYGDLYKSDITQLRLSIRSNNVTESISILEEMADNIPNYNQEDKNSLLLLVQSYARELYSNELIGLNQLGVLTKHKNVLCYINAQCSQTLNLNNESATQKTEQPEITKKSRSVRKNAPVENAPVETKQNLESVDNFASTIQTDIDIIRHARILAHYRQDGTPVGDITTINNSIKQWFAEFLKTLKKALAKKDKVS